MLKCQKAKGSNQNVKCPENVGKGQKKGGSNVENQKVHNSKCRLF